MTRKEVINEIISKKELTDSLLLLAWIQESEENRNAYIKLKNRHALMQDGHGMADHEILKALESVRETSKRTNVKTSRSLKEIILKNSFVKYAAIVVLAILGGYLYNLTSDALTPKVSMSEISVLEGQRNTFLLPDGSEVILVNNSKVIYPSKFIGKAREVYLEGEAYITVSHNKKQPFIVHVGDHQIEVLGTEFLVTAHPQEELIQVDLVSGKVKMNVAKLTNNDDYDSYLLEPFENLVLNKTNRGVQVEKTQDDFYKFWKEGEYRFKKETFESLALKLERIYHIKLLFESEAISSCEFTGAIYPNMCVGNVLDAFKLSSSIPFEYNIKNGRIFIKQKRLRIDTNETS